MKLFVVACAIFLSGLTLSAQKPIDKLQKNNSEYLGKMEADGFEFRSQIITEFNAENAQQNVNILLQEGYTYQLVALGDSDIMELDVEIKSAKKFQVSESAGTQTAGGKEVKTLVPEKSGKFKITLDVKRFSDSGKGFVSFMVLRK